MLRVMTVSIIAVCSSLASVRETGPTHVDSSVTIDLSAPEYLGCGRVSINGGVSGDGVMIERIEWDWGDGSVTESFFPAYHRYTATGEYAVTATAHATTGESDSASTTAVIAELPDPGDPSCSPIQVTLSEPEFHGCGMVELTGNVVAFDGQIVDFEWDWGDGFTDHQWMPARHTFAADGSYLVSVEVSDDLGGSGSASTVVDIADLGEPACSLMADLVPHTLVLRDGVTTGRVRAFIRDPEGRAVDPASLDLVIESSDPSVVQVGADGAVTAAGFGRAELQLKIDGVVKASSVVRAGHARLLPPMLVLSMDAHPTGQLDIDAANADGTPVDLAEHEVVFWMDHPNVASVDGAGLVTAHKVPDGGFESPHLTGAIDMLSFGNVVDVVVFQSDPGAQVEGFVDASIGTYTLDHIGTVDYSELFADYHVPMLLEVGYQLEARLTGIRPWDGEWQYIINYSHDLEAPCGINGNPTRCGTNFVEPEMSCYLEWGPPDNPHPHPHPRWGIFFHEIGHNFTLTSVRFTELARTGTASEGTWVEGLATACSMYVAEMVSSNATAMGLESFVVDGLTGAWLSWRREGTEFLDAYVAGGANYATIDPNILDDMLKILIEEHGWQMLYRLFSLFLPEDESFQIAIDSDERQATLFVAAVSAATGEDTRSLFRDSWGFPVDDAFYASIFPRVERWVSRRDPAVFAGADRAATWGDTTTLDDAYAIDWEDDSLQYSWQIQSRPAWSVTQLIDPGELNAAFTPDRPGTYVLALTASDGFLVSRSDSVKVEVAAGPYIFADGFETGGAGAWSESTQ